MAVDPNTLNDPVQLRKLMENARAKGHPALVTACQVRIAELAGLAYDEPLEREFWTALTIAEEIATANAGATRRLSRTRQKVKRVGAVQCLTDWADEPKVTDGFKLLVEGGRSDLTAEAIVLRHPGRFDTETKASARAKLRAHGVDP